jgi:ribosomal RNA-processing protein 12
MEDSLIDQLVTTILCMLQSPNREVIKAGLGFIKVVVICVQPSLLEHQLENLVVSILKHSRSHTSHFKAKVRHIFERLIRKNSYEAVDKFVPEEDKKLIVNIKKRKERAKKKMIQAKNEVTAPAEDESTTVSHQKSYEEVLASDESDLGTDNEEEAGESEDDSRKDKKKVFGSQ